MTQISGIGFLAISLSLSCCGQVASQNIDIEVREGGDTDDPLGDGSSEGTDTENFDSRMPVEEDTSTHLPRPPFCAVRVLPQEFGAPGSCQADISQPADTECLFNFADTMVASTLCDRDETRCTVPRRLCANGWCHVPSVSFVSGWSSQLEPDAPFSGLMTAPPSRKLIDRPYWVMETEVTRGDFARLMGYSHPESMPCVEMDKGRLVASKRECPAAFGSVFEAMDYANRVSSMFGLPSCYDLSGCGEKVVSAGDAQITIHMCDSSRFVGTSCPGVRLPTIAEAELTARGGTLTWYPNASVVEINGLLNCSPHGPAAKIAWHCANAYALREGCPTDTGEWPNTCLSPQPVGMLLANPFGIYDAQGNLAELTQKVFCRQFPGTADCDPGTNVSLEEFDSEMQANDAIVATGGTYLGNPLTTCSMCQTGLGASYPNYHLQGIGLRLVRTDLDDCNSLRMPAATP